MSWIAPLLVTVFGGLLRFQNLALPKGKVFDEVYYVTGAQQLLAHGVEFNAEKSTADFVVHPPLGKWIIALGIRTFGDSEFGWRFSVAALGSLSILILARVARRLFQSDLLGVTAGLLLAVEGLHFTHSRTALLDLILMFFVLCAFGFLLLDRDQRRKRLGDGLALGFTPFRYAAALSLGLACGVKWSGLYYLAAFALLALVWDFGAHRRYQRPISLRSLAGFPVTWGLLPLATYVATWTGWFTSSLGWDRHWSKSPWKSLWHYHAEIYHFHTTLRTSHPYQSNPWSWLLLGRPTAFYYQSYPKGQHGCVVSTCSEAVMAIGNPVIWWFGVIALAITTWAWVAMRDWRAGAIVVGIAAGYLPWFFFQERTVYNFYAVVFVPWIVLAVTYVLGLFMGREINRTRALFVGAYVALAIVVFFYMLPVLDAQMIPEDAWRARMWLPSWI